MHVIEKFQTGVTLFGRDGRAWSYRTIRALIEDVGLEWVGRNVGEHFREFSHAEWRTADGGRFYGGPERAVSLKRFYQEAQFTLRDDAGKVVTYAACWNAVRAPVRAIQAKRATDGPVEGTGKRRNRYHRRSSGKFINTVRAAQTFVEEGEVPVRTARGRELLQSKWDSDYWRGNHQERCWKKFRKTQWK